MHLLVIWGLQSFRCFHKCLLKALGEEDRDDSTAQTTGEQREKSEGWISSCQIVVRPICYLVYRIQAYLPIKERDKERTSVVDPPPPGAAAHLDVLPARDPAEALAVKLACVCEDDGLGGHVEARGEGLGRKQRLDVALLEDQLHDLLQDGQQAGMVHLQD